MKIRDEVRDEVRKICAAHKDEPSPLMVVLEEVQKKYGYVAMEVQTLISEEMGIPVAEIYGVVTFYNFFSLTPKGKYVINVCLGTACYVKGSQPILDKFNEVLGIKEGQTTKDGFFTLEAVRCMGACALAPAVNVNGKVYPQVKVGQVEQIVAEYRAKEAA
jgi:NADH-quinone oxidoreductase subunit E/NADP-reducing hydrogenase subunit HndA